MSRWSLRLFLLAVGVAALLTVGWGTWVVAPTVASDAPAAAADVETFTVFRITVPGDFVYQNGTLVRFGTQPPNPPVPPDDPVVPPVVPSTDLAKVVVAEISKVAASDARHGAATKLGAAYDALSGTTIPATKAVEVANAMTAMVLTAADRQLMAGAMTAVNTALAKCTTDVAVAATFKEAGAACVSTVPASEAAVAQMRSDLAAADQDELKALGERYSIDWTAFMQMVMQFITVVLPIILQLIKSAAVFGQFMLLA